MTRSTALRKLVRPALLVVGAATCAALLALSIGVARTPLPPALSQKPAESLRVLDRDGRLLDEHRLEQGLRSSGVRLRELPGHVTAAVLAAEDARFHRHPGIDPLAMARALGQALWHGRIVSGASTITQQLARAVVPRPRTLRGKLQEILIALRIERELDKDTILEDYLSRIEFAPQVRGLDAVSRHLFDKPAHRLDLAEAALLAGLPRGPSLYNPARGVERARQRRDRILGRMAKAGLASEEAVRQARAQPVRLHRGFRWKAAEHLVRAVGNGTLATAPNPLALGEVHTTLDGDLQAIVQGLSRQVVAKLESHDASSAAVLVVDNATREVLAYVGAPDFWSRAALGQNDGTRALRQPGSTLKPFLYAAAIDSLGYGAATLLPDIELHLPTPQGDYSPRNYDGSYHGPVRLRYALANSLNVPAVYTAQRLGPQRVLAELHRFGFESLKEDPAHYGAAIALGDGEVTLAELAAAYATLANRGAYRPLRFLRDAALAEKSVQVVPEPIADLLTDILADRRTRQAAFGRDSVLDLPFPAAVKTGTSKGFRDNWTIGYTREVTVAVWVGNFDGRPMRGSSGVTGAGPLFREVLLAAMGDRVPDTLLHREHFDTASICPLSGERATPLCPHSIEEHFLRGRGPTKSCSFHQEALVAASSGQRATNACSDAERRVFETYPELYRAWALQARRPLLPASFDPRCPGRRNTPVQAAPPTAEVAPRNDLGVTYPFAGARFAIDPNVTPERQRILLRARGAAENEPLWFVLNGRRLGATRAPHELAWRLTSGAHELHVEAGGRVSPTIRFRVD